MPMTSQWYVEYGSFAKETYNLKERTNELYITCLIEMPMTSQWYVKWYVCVMRNMTYSHMRHKNTFCLIQTPVTCLNDTPKNTSQLNVTWRIYICDMTKNFVSSIRQWRVSMIRQWLCFIDGFWLAIFRTNLVRGLSNNVMKFRRKGAVLVQIAPLLISQPRNPSIGTAMTLSRWVDKDFVSMIWESLCLFDL